jgi:TP901 family phage tail tape measure protein
MAEVAKGIIDIEINTGGAASQLQALQAQINAFNLALNKSNKAQGTFAAEYSRELQSAINKTGLFTAETIRLQTAAATLDKTLSKGKTSLGQFFSAKFNKDSAIAAETMALASERARRLQTQFIATAGAANGFQDALAVRPLAAFSSEAAVAAQRTQILSNMFKQGTTQLINFGKNVQWAGRQLMVGFTVPLTIFGAVAGKTFMELEKQGVAFKKVYGDIFTTPAELNQNLEAVKDLASEYTKYGIAVKDTIGLAAQAAAAGRQNADLTDAVSQATRLATLGQMDQNAALETTISLQSAFRLSGQDLADTINFLNMVENQTVVSLQDIAAAIPRVAPVIQGLGGDVKDLTVFLAAMQEGGVDAAEGANALKSGLASLINPTKQATEMLNGMGINLETIIQANKGDLMGTVRSFAEALQGLDQFSRQQALEQVFGKFQYAKLGALFENISREGSQAQQVIATMGYSTEQLGATADKELKTIEESFGVQLTGAVERFKLAIAPIGEIFVRLAIPLVNFATKIVESFNGLSDGQKRFAAIAAVIVGVVIPAVTMMAGLFLNLVGTLAKIGQGMALFGKGFITGGPVGAIKALTQSSKYLSLAEMDAAMAAQQLSGASKILNTTLVEQAITGNAAAAAINNLTRAYSAMIATQGAAGSLPSFGLASAAGNAAREGKSNTVRVRGLRRNFGGGVPGTGNTDTVPAMLTPGEFVVNKEAAKNNLGLLKTINDGGVQRFSQGGDVLNEEDAVRRIGFGATGKTDISSVRRSSPKQQTGMTFAHMQKNIVSNDNPKIRNDFFEEIYQQYKNNFPKNPSSSEINKLADLEAGRLNNWNNWKAVGNLGFEISSKTNTALTKSANPTVKTLDFIKELDDLFKSGKNPYEAMLRNSGVPEGEILKASKGVHASVSNYLERMHSRGITTISDRILYGNKGPLTSGLIPRAVIRGLKSSGIDQKNISELFKIFDGNTINSSSMSALRSGSLNLDELVKQGKIISHEPVIATKGRNKGNIRSSGRLVTFNDGTKGIVGIKGTNISLSKTLKSLGSSEDSKKILNLLLSAVTKKRIKLNSGGPVPGTGSKDTVPAMLTPGEFVVNKKATSQNKQLLQAMNDGGNVRGYALGGIVAGATRLASSRTGKYVGGTAAGIGGYSAGKALTGGNEIGGIIGSIVGPMLPKAAVAVAAAMGVSTAAFVGVTAPLALAGFAIYKLNKSLDEARKSGAELSKAMYGSSKTVKDMADAFGRETRATTIRRKAVEKAGKQEITPEAVTASGEFMKTEAASQIIKDLELVKKSGEDVALALRNQLASSIIAGAITPEEAKAVAIDMGKALGDEKIAIRVAGQLSSLLGPDGEKITNNILEITAEISPKINSQKIKNDAEDAYNSLNIAQKFGEIFTGGKESFVEQFSIDKIAEENASALTKEAEARALLNLAYEEGTITLKEYLEQEGKITTGASIREDVVNNANAVAAGYKTYDQMIGNLESTAKEIQNLEGDFVNPGTIAAVEGQGASLADSIIPGSEEFRKYLEPAKEAYKQELLNSGFGPEAAQAMVDGIENNLTQTDVRIFDKFISGQIPDNGYDILIRLQAAGDLTAEDIDRISKELTAINTIPNVDKILNFNMSDEADLTQLYKDYMALEETPDIYNTVNIKDEFSDTLEAFGMKYEELMALPNQEKIVLLRNIQTYETITSAINLEKTNKGGYVDAGMTNQRVTAANALNSAIKAATQPITGGDTPTTGGSGGGGGGKQTLAQYIKEFEKATAAKIKYFNATKQVLGAEDQEILALIDTEMYLKANAKQRQHLLSLAKDQLNIQKAVAFLSLSAQEKELQGLDAISKALDIKSQKDNALLRARQRDIELNNRALDKLAEKEDAVNKTYDSKIEALNKISQANDRIAEQDSSRISLASALASGDIAAAANAASDMQQKEAQYQIEDAQAALEIQRQRDLESLTVSVNGVLMTRAQIEASNKLIQDQILVIEDALYAIEDQRFKNAQEREKLETAIYLLQMKQNIEALRAQDLSGAQLANLQALIDQYNAVATAASAAGVATPGLAGNTALGAGGGAFTSPAPIDASGASTAAAPAAPTGTIPGDTLFNQMIELYEKLSEADKKDFDKIAEINPGANYSKWIARRAAGNISNGNLNNVIEAMKDGKITKAEVKKYDKLLKFNLGGKVSYKGSTESPPALKMNYGSTVPGRGMTDKIPAMLTPGEFVVRKSVADKNRGFLNSLNSQVFPGMGGTQGVPTNNFLDGIGSPRYSIPESGVADIPTGGTNIVSPSSTMYNSTYNVNVNVSGTNASPDDIANVVMSKLSQQNRGNLRSTRY